jgi:hypothetical protein
MASTTKNQPSASVNVVVPSLVTKLTRGFPAKLGSVTAQNDVVAFTVPEPTRDNQGAVVIQAIGGVTPTYALEASLDGGVSWFTLTVAANPTISAASFGDTSSFAAVYTIAGFGSGAQFRFGRTDATGGAAVVWALVG